MRMMLAFKEEF